MNDKDAIEACGTTRNGVTFYCIQEGCSNGECNEELKASRQPITNPVVKCSKCGNQYKNGNTLWKHKQTCS